MHCGLACAPPQTRRSGELGATKKRMNVTMVIPMQRTTAQRMRLTTYGNTATSLRAPYVLHSDHGRCAGVFARARGARVGDAALPHGARAVRAGPAARGCRGARRRASALPGARA